jgi:Domain of unknown function (DUF4158)
MLGKGNDIARKAKTRTDHLKSAARYLGWKHAAAGRGEMKELGQFLLDRAMEHDSPTLLFNLAREYLMSAKVIRPGAVTLAKMVGTARAGAGELTSQKMGHLLTLQVRQDLDLLMTYDAGLGMTRLAWLTTAAVEATASAVKTSIEKLAWLRNMDAHSRHSLLAWRSPFPWVSATAPAPQRADRSAGE